MTIEPGKVDADVIEKLLFILKSSQSSREDESGFFSHPVDPKKYPDYDKASSRQVDLASIQESFEQGNYSTLESFQDDFDVMIKNAISYFPPAHSIYKAAIKLSTFGTRLLNSLYEKILPPRTLADLPPPEPPKRGRPKGQKDKSNRHQKVVLVQRGVDGQFFFSNSQRRDVDDVPAAFDVSKVKVVPTPALPVSSVPALSQVASLRTSKSQQESDSEGGIRQLPVDFLDYGVFQSFAPSHDSSRASLSTAESASVVRPRRVVIESLPEPDEVPVYNGNDEVLHGSSVYTLTTTPIVPPLAPQTLLNRAKQIVDEAEELPSVDESSLSSLSKETLDWKPLLTALEQEIGFDDLLTENSLLLEKLLEYQKQRFANGKQTVSAEEAATAERVLQNLSHLVQNASPNSLVSKSMIEQGLKIVSLYEPCFKGTLPLDRSFAYPSNFFGRNAFPNSSGSKPSYSIA